MQELAGRLKVSTHSRLKAAGNPKDGDKEPKAVSTHSRLKAAGGVWGQSPRKTVVSTHSRLKAAGVMIPAETYSSKVFQHTAA